MPHISSGPHLRNWTRVIDHWERWMNMTEHKYKYKFKLKYKYMPHVSSGPRPSNWSWGGEWQWLMTKMKIQSCHSLNPCTLLWWEDDDATGNAIEFIRNWLRAVTFLIRGLEVRQSFCPVSVLVTTPIHILVTNTISHDFCQTHCLETLIWEASIKGSGRGQFGWLQLWVC